MGGDVPQLTVTQPLLKERSLNLVLALPVSDQEAVDEAHHSKQQPLPQIILVHECVCTGEESLCDWERYATEAKRSAKACVESAGTLHASRIHLPHFSDRFQRIEEKPCRIARNLCLRSREHESDQLALPFPRRRASSHRGRDVEFCQQSREVERQTHEHRRAPPWHGLPEEFDGFVEALARFEEKASVEECQREALGESGALAWIAASGVQLEIEARRVAEKLEGLVGRRRPRCLVSGFKQMLFGADGVSCLAKVIGKRRMQTRRRLRTGLEIDADIAMQMLATNVKNRVVGDLLDHGMLEAISDSSHLVAWNKQVRSHKLLQGIAELGHCGEAAGGNRLQGLPIKRSADYRRDLQQELALGIELVDPRHDDLLHRGRDRCGGKALGGLQSRTTELHRALFQEGAQDFFDIKGIACRLTLDPLAELSGQVLAVEQSVQKLARGTNVERTEFERKEASPEGFARGLEYATGGLLVSRARSQKEHHRRICGEAHQRLKELEGGAVCPVQVLEYEHEGVALGDRLEQFTHRVGEELVQCLADQVLHPLLIFCWQREAQQHEHERQDVRGHPPRDRGDLDGEPFVGGGLLPFRELGPGAKQVREGVEAQR